MPKTKKKKPQKAGLQKLYFLLVSVISLFAFIGLYGQAIYQILHHNIISDEMYIVDHRWEIEGCKNKLNRSIGEKTIYASEEDVQMCKQTERNNIIQDRKVKLYESLLTGGMRGTMFLILFLLHYPRFRKKD